MKQLLVLLTLIIFCSSIHAQEKLYVKERNTLQYLVSVQTQSFPMFFYIDSFNNNNLTLTWSFEDGRTGKFITTKASLYSATYGYYTRPNDGEELVLPGTQSLLFFSKSVFAALQKNGKAVFDEALLTVKPSTKQNAFKLSGKIIDALYTESESGAKIWVLNNPDSPVILKIENNPVGVNVELTGIN